MMVISTGFITYVHMNANRQGVVFMSAPAVF